MNISEELKSKPWYKNPMVWMVIFFPSMAVVGGLITITIAIKTDDGLVVDDYYKQGLQINKVIEFDKNAKDTNLSALVDANIKTGEILVSLKADSTLEMQKEITFKLIHRTRPGLDQVTTLRQVEGSSSDYRGYIKPPIIEGRWSIQIVSPNNWRLKQSFTTKSAGNILLNITS